MSITEWSLRNNVTSLAIFILIAVAGVITLATIPRQEDPDFVVRTAVVTTQFPGASPQKVEELVTDKLEEKIREMGEVDYVESQSFTGLSIIEVNIYESIRDVAPAWQKLRNKVDDTIPLLPPEASVPYVNDEFGDVFGFLIALTSDGYTYREMKDEIDIIRNKILRFQKVSKVELWGEQEERIFIEFSNARFAELGVSPFALASVIQSQNIIKPSGQVYDDPERINIRSTGEFLDVDDIRQLSLRFPGGKESVALSDLTDIKRGFVDPPTTMVQYNGKPAILLAVSMKVGNNIIQLGKELTTLVENVNEELPAGLDLEMAIYTPEYVQTSIFDFLINLAQAFVFVILVMLLFAGIRVGLICGTLVPMAMLTALIFMPLFDVMLERISIAAMIIALGILVDNGVVVSESILVKLGAGQDRKQAVISTAKELSFPLLAASLTTVFAFLPIPLAPSSAGEYCVSLFVVITLTLAASWLLSMTMVPMMCFYLLKPQPSVETFSSKIYNAYRKLLMLALKNRFIALAIVFGLFGAALTGFKSVPNIFFPPNERGQFMIDFWQPYGTDIRATERRYEKLEKFLMKQKEFKSVLTFVGTGGPRWYLPLDLEQQNENLATLIINIDSFDHLESFMDKTEHEIIENFPDTRFRLKEMMLGPPAGASIELRVAGDSIEELYDLREKIGEILKNTSGVTVVWDDWGEWTKEFVIEVNQDRARRAGLSSQDIAMSMQMQMSELPVSEFRDGDTVIPIVLRSDDDYRDQADKIPGMNVYSYTEKLSVPLAQVANAHFIWQPSNVRRRDEVRTMTVMADVVGRYASDALQEIKPKLDKLVESDQWPLNYTLEVGGEDEESRKAQAALMANMPLAMGLLIIVLVTQFNSIRKPIIILLTLPPMMIGVAPGMLLTGQPFGFMPLLGLISLLGIIVNNAIMLIDRIDVLEKSGVDIRNALVLSGLQRSRPIIMTTITTIVGLVPLIVSGGGMWRPMAVLMVSGLTVASGLTLVLCPVLYSTFFRVNFKGYEWDSAILNKAKE
ncbi:efflux RND transporter permease subunit [Halodesulfovibrio sp. MK-HDV]|jgi:multidrug efflux pump subunit AcrB|uniref:efflux RND transporter permease subunit n=1 Tax=unclassified Halodesulfovibrio TaxID=2644657 RepID=UPI0013688976|nr:efflux RND transporter permease subunit [Halodesulfovibrio sp. MK-HDV]KAF1074835.1 Swarming motility protein SwrC [Halodesulfovibrio sp. MK-HDV]